MLGNQLIDVSRRLGSPRSHPHSEAQSQRHTSRLASGNGYRLIAHGLAVLVVSMLTGLFLYNTIDFALDDSYITYRYAQHLELGYGPVFNAGEPYLGTTAPGFAILLAVLHLAVRILHLSELLSMLLGTNQANIVTLLDIPHLGRYVSAFSVGITGITGYAFLVRSFPNWLGYLGGLLFAVWIITLPPLALVSGHETLTCIALVVLGLYFVPTRLPLGALLLGVATLVRPDAALAFAVVVFAMILKWFAQRDRKQIYSDAQALLFFLLPVVPWVLFAWFFYGSPIPGTLLAKKAQVLMGNWSLTSPDLMRVIVLNSIPEAIRTLINFSALMGLVAAVLRRDAAALVGVWGVAHIYAYNFLKVTFWPWYATLLFVVYLLMSAYGAVAVANLIWSARRASGRRLHLQLWAVPHSSLTSEADRRSQLWGMRTPFSTPKWAYLATLPLLAIYLWICISGISPGLAAITGPKAVHLHTYSFIPVADYIKKEMPEGASLATPEPGALAYFLGPKYYVLDTLGLTAPGVAAHILTGDYEWPYLYYQPDWVLVSYEGNLNPNLQKPWFKAQYRLVKEFKHPYWDAQGITLRLFRKTGRLGDNVLINSNFTSDKEKGLLPWNVPGDSSVRVEQTTEGNALVLTGTEIGDNLNATQSVNAQPNRQYLVSFQYRNRVIDEMQRVYLQVFDRDGKLVDTFPTGAGYGVPASDNWGSALFSAHTKAEGDKLVIILRNRGIGEAWFRNVEVRAVISEDKP